MVYRHHSTRIRIGLVPTVASHRVVTRPATLWTRSGHSSGWSATTRTCSLPTNVFSHSPSPFTIHHSPFTIHHHHHHHHQHQHQHQDQHRHPSSTHTRGQVPTSIDGSSTRTRMALRTTQRGVVQERLGAPHVPSPSRTETVGCARRSVRASLRAFSLRNSDGTRQPDIAAAPRLRQIV